MAELKPLTVTVAEMTLRDWFAGIALSGLNAASDYSSGPCNAAAAERCYALADAMLREKDKYERTQDPN